MTMPSAAQPGRNRDSVRGSPSRRATPRQVVRAARRSKAMARSIAVSATPRPLREPQRHQRRNHGFDDRKLIHEALEKAMLRIPAARKPTRAPTVSYPEHDHGGQDVEAGLNGLERLDST